MAPRDETLAGPTRSHLRGCLLLLIREAPAHGYDLLVQLGDFGFEGIDPGGVYRALRAMEQEGLVASAWEPSTSGPARRTYGITAAGSASLDAWAGAARQRARELEAFVDRYEKVRKPAHDR